jgi:RHS repeat-associated protein
MVALIKNIHHDGSKTRRGGAVSQRSTINKGTQTDNIPIDTTDDLWQTWLSVKSVDCFFVALPQCPPLPSTASVVQSVDNFGALSRGESIFCGYRFDVESQLYYVRNRTYSPTLGRWLQRDPIGYAGGINLYEYVGGKAVIKIDPTGHYSHKECAAECYAKFAICIGMIGLAVGSLFGCFGYLFSCMRGCPPPQHPPEPCPWPPPT